MVVSSGTGWAQGTGAATGTPTIRAESNLVVVDVEVLDHAGKPVRGLGREQFAVTEGGKAQVLQSFEEHRAPAMPVAPEAPLRLPPGVYTNYTPVPATPALDVLLIDALNTPMEAQSELQRQMHDYIRKAPRDRRIAIFGLRDRLYLLQGFTSDPELLRAGLERGGVRSSPLLDTPIGQAPARQLSDVVGTLGAGDGTYAGGPGATPDERLPALGALRQFEARVAANQLKDRVRLTVDAMDALAHYLSGLPGRKNLLWLSGAFPLNLAPSGAIADSFVSYADLRPEFEDTVNVLAQAQVAVYPVDVRGLFNAPQLDPSQQGTVDGAQAASQIQQFGALTAEEHTTMRQMAQQTGGQAFVNTNGLEQAVATVVGRGDDFYTLTYAPATAPKPGEYRGIGVKLVGVGERTELSYRRGYFGAERGGSEAEAKGTERLRESPGVAGLQAAMTHGAPDATELLLKVQAAPAVSASEPAEETVASTTRVNPGEKSAKGPWRRYVVDVAVAPGMLPDPVAGGQAPVAVQLLIDGYDTDGRLLTAASGSARLRVPEKNLAAFTHGALRMRQVISVPDRGDVSLRVGVQDQLHGRVGSVEIPVAAIKKLPPATPSTAGTGSAGAATP